MDALVSNTTVTGPELVKAVSALMPGSNVSAVLDTTSNIIVQRIVNTIKSKQFDTVFHLVKAILSYEQSEENSTKAMLLISNDLNVSQELKFEIEKFLDSGLINSVSKFMEEPVKKKRWLCF
jgi:hypothetical protein